MRGLDDELLAKYLAGEAGPDDRARVEAWANSDQAAASELRRLRAAWALRPPPGSWDLEAAWERVSARIEEPVTLPVTSRRPAWLAVAAAAVVLVAAGILARSRSDTTFTTRPGTQQEITLEDGSRVVLAPASTLSLSGDYGNPAREVTLEGRAWFEVRHEASRPFRVRTRQAIVEDLGTEFEVAAPADGGPARIAVVMGSVAVRPTEDSTAEAIVLGPRDVAQVGRSGTPVVRHAAPVEELVRWRDGTLAFDDATLSEIAAELGRWYGLEFRLADSVLAGRHLSATFPTQDLGEVLDVLRVALDLVISRRDGAVVLEPRRSP